MSCNPSFGGVGKGILIREIDALDGVCGRVCDVAGIHFRMLNASRGPAVHGPRAQMDRKLYRQNMQQILFNYPNLSILAASVKAFIRHSDLLMSVEMEDGTMVKTKKIVLATGTFLSGTIRIGKTD
jgi:tRNA uridine 5-carboxymethylaminomethyl modification enzyme